MVGRRSCRNRCYAQCDSECPVQRSLLPCSTLQVATMYYKLMLTNTLWFKQYAVLFFKATHLSWRLKGFYILVHILNRLKLQVEKEHMSHLKYDYVSYTQLSNY